MTRPASWDAYEDAVMAGEDAPQPPDDYEMSERFREWVLERMRAEVAAQVSGAGLDRMAVVRSQDAEEDAEAEEGGAGAGARNGEAGEPA